MLGQLLVAAGPPTVHVVGVGQVATAGLRHPAYVLEAVEMHGGRLDDLLLQLVCSVTVKISEEITAQQVEVEQNQQKHHGDG